MIRIDLDRLDWLSQRSPERSIPVIGTGSDLDQKISLSRAQRPQFAQRPTALWLLSEVKPLLKILHQEEVLTHKVLPNPRTKTSSESS